MLDRSNWNGKVMRNVVYLSAFATFVAVSAVAMTAEIDTDGDNLASYTELQVVYPELSQELFQKIDTDADGLVNDEEMAIAIKLGNLADPEVDS
jgi:hypothetical protein